MEARILPIVPIRAFLSIVSGRPSSQKRQQIPELHVSTLIEIGGTG